MPTLNLSVDEVLSTTRAVRRRLDLTRPVELDIIQECLELAIQAPTPGGMQNWHFIIVTDPVQRRDLANVYRKSTLAPGGQGDFIQQMLDNIQDAEEKASMVKKIASAQYLTEHLHEVPVLVVPCIEGRTENMSMVENASHWGEIMPATWSFMLAARSRGLGTVLTTLHLDFEQDAADILGIDYQRVMQAGMIPVAYTLGTDFKPAPRNPLSEVLHWDRW